MSYAEKKMVLITDVNVFVVAFITICQKKKISFCFGRIPFVRSVVCRHHAPHFLNPYHSNKPHTQKTKSA